MSRMQRRVFLVSVVGLATACPDRSLRDQSKQGCFSLEVLLSKEGSSEPELLENGGTLRSGDRFALRLTVLEPLYLYVEHHAASGTAGTLHPSPPSPPLLTLPGTPLTVPADGSLQLDDRTGRESLWVVASRTLLSVEQAQAVVKEASSGQTTEREPPPTSTVRGSGGRGKVLWGGLRDSGLGVIRFRLNHV
ncbi:MAG: DUF4384 domain-containing protein [Myxococcales bacterium]|nr:DUF4384 domain-containing protein [Myxococcales bacterium]